MDTRSLLCPWVTCCLAVCFSFGPPGPLFLFPEVGVFMTIPSCPSGQVSPDLLAQLPRFTGCTSPQPGPAPAFLLPSPQLRARGILRLVPRLSGPCDILLDSLVGWMAVHSREEWVGTEKQAGPRQHQELALWAGQKFRGGLSEQTLSQTSGSRCKDSCPSEAGGSESGRRGMGTERLRRSWCRAQGVGEGRPLLPQVATGGGEAVRSAEPCEGLWAFPDTNLQLEPKVSGSRGARMPGWRRDHLKPLPGICEFCGDGNPICLCRESQTPDVFKEVTM